MITVNFTFSELPWDVKVERKYLNQKMCTTVTLLTVQIYIIHYPSKRTLADPGETLVTCPFPGPTYFITARQQRGKGYVFTHVCLSVILSTRGSHVTLTYDALDLTVQGPPILVPSLSRHQTSRTPQPSIQPLLVASEHLNI